MLKKIALSILFAITFATGIGAAQAASTAAGVNAPTSPTPHVFCPKGVGWC